jgi:hypothetical protein
MAEDNFRTPPVRDVPTAVSQRIEARVFAGISAQTRWGGTRWLGVAAAVVAIGALGLSVGHFLPKNNLETGQGVGLDSGQGQSGQAASSPSLDVHTATTDLDRCQNAVRGDARFPSRDQWQPLFQVTGPAITVTAARVAGKPLFCETTAAAVTVSIPDAVPAYVPGSRTGSVLITRDGIIAGVLDPGWRAPRVAVTTPQKDSYSGPAQSRDGLFVFVSPQSTANATMTIQGGSASRPLPLPGPATPPVTVADAGMSAGDRSSTRGKLLGQCIENAQSDVVDAGTWNPGAMVVVGGQRVIMAVNQLGISACVSETSRTQFLAYAARPLPAGVSRPALMGVAPTVGGRPLVAGVLPQGATQVELTLSGGATVVADVANSTFAVLLPASVVSSPAPSGPVVKDMSAITCRVLGASGQTLYSGPLAG